MVIEIIECTGKRQMISFIRFPKELYKADENFVFEPESLQREFFSKNNPFFSHSSARYFLAISGGKVLGRIASIVNTRHNLTFSERTGFFGFFESVEIYEVARLLLDKVVETIKLEGFRKIIGPTNFTTNDSCGFLISGFEKAPVVLMPYNKTYYLDYMNRYGFHKEIGLSSYIFSEKVLKEPFLGRNSGNIEEKLESAGISIRNINYKNLEEDIIQLRYVYNESNKNNWGFVPLDEKEFRNMARQFRQFVPENMVFLVEKSERQIGFLVTLPDLNQVFKKIRSGKLYPFGFIKYLWYSRKIDNCRILILGILDEYRNKGLDLILYEKLRQNLSISGFKGGEACYVMENNSVMHSILKKIGFKEVNHYRIFKYGIQA